MRGNETDPPQKREERRVAHEQLSVLLVGEPLRKFSRQNVGSRIVFSDDKQQSETKK